MEYEEEQTDALRGRLEVKINSLNTRRWVLEGRGQFQQVDMLDYEIHRFQTMLEEKNSRRRPQGTTFLREKG